MVKLVKAVGTFVLALSFISVASTIGASAQASDDALFGRWQLEANAVFIEVENLEAQTVATITRDDWAPGRVGLVHIFEFVSNGKKTWNAKVRMQPDSDIQSARLRLRSNDRLVLKTTSGKPQTLRYKKVE